MQSSIVPDLGACLLVHPWEVDFVVLARLVLRTLAHVAGVEVVQRRLFHALDRLELRVHQGLGVLGD